MTANIFICQSLRLGGIYRLTEHFISTVDPLHKGGTTDVHIWKDGTFEWMVKLFGICKELNNKLGKE